MAALKSNMTQALCSCSEPEPDLGRCSTCLGVVLCECRWPVQSVRTITLQRSGPCLFCNGAIQCACFSGAQRGGRNGSCLTCGGAARCTCGGQGDQQVCESCGFGGTYWRNEDIVAQLQKKQPKKERCPMHDGPIGNLVSKKAPKVKGTSPAKVLTEPRLRATSPMPRPAMFAVCCTTPTHACSKARYPMSICHCSVIQDVVDSICQTCAQRIACKCGKPEGLNKPFGFLKNLGQCLTCKAVLMCACSAGPTAGGACGACFSCGGGAKCICPVAKPVTGSSIPCNVCGFGGAFFIICEESNVRELPSAKMVDFSQALTTLDETAPVLRSAEADQTETESTAAPSQRWDANVIDDKTTINEITEIVASPDSNAGAVASPMSSEKEKTDKTRSSYETQRDVTTTARKCKCGECSELQPHKFRKSCLSCKCHLSDHEPSADDLKTERRKVERVIGMDFDEFDGKQIPVHDIHPTDLENFTAEEKENYDDYIKELKENALGRASYVQAGVNAVCEGCQKAFDPDAKAIKARERCGDRLWHPECFVCCTCGRVLKDWVLCKENRLYCGRHYGDLSQSRCVACQELIFASSYAQAEDHAYHLNHFTCRACDAELGGVRYMMKQEEVYCIPCHDYLFAQSCTECQGKIGADQKKVSCSTGGREVHWHGTRACFSCANCRTFLLHVGFVYIYGKPFCATRCSDAWIETNQGTKSTAEGDQEPVFVQCKECPVEAE